MKQTVNDPGQEGIPGPGGVDSVEVVGVGMIVPAVYIGVTAVGSLGDEDEPNTCLLYTSRCV